MRTLITLILCLWFVALAASTPLWFDTSNCILKKRSDRWYQFSIPPLGVSDYYQYRYYDLPAGWDYLDNDLLIPYDFSTGRYQFRLNLYDAFWKRDLSKYVVLQLYEDDLDGYRVYLRDSYDSLYNIKYTYRYQDKELYEFPSWDTVSSLIEQGDVDQIEGIIYKVLDSNNYCDDKRQYLTGILSRIERFLDIYETGIVSLKAENVQLYARIRSNEAEIKDLKYLISDSITKLNYQLSRVNSRIAYYEKQIAEDQKDIEDYAYSQQQLKDKISDILNVEIAELLSQIENFSNLLSLSTGRYCAGCSIYSRYYYSYEKNKYRDLVYRREQRIIYLRREARQLQIKIQFYERKIVQIRGSQNAKKDSVASLVAQRNALQEQIANVKYDSGALRRIEELEAAILESKSNIEKNLWEIQVSQKASRILRAALGDLRSIIYRSYYTCQDYLILDPVVDSYYYRFGFTPSTFRDYALSSYRLDLTSTYDGLRIPSYYRTNDRINAIRSNYFSSDWIDAYGRPFDYSSYRYGSRLFNEDYECRYDDDSYFGRIRRIEGRTIYVRSRGKDYSLRLGDCSSLDVFTGRYIPRVDDLIAYKGYRKSVRNYENLFYVHSAMIL